MKATTLDHPLSVTAFACASVLTFAREERDQTLSTPDITIM